MKTLIVSALLLASAAVSAAEVKVFESELPKLRYRTHADASFQVDADTREGFVRVTVTETQTPDYFPAPDCTGTPRGPICYPRHSRSPISFIILKKTVKVEGLELVGDKVTYHGAEGAVECGTLGVSRVFRRPTIYLNGNCELDAQVLRGREGSKVVVTLSTK